MKTATITDFRKNIKKHLQEVESDQDILIVSAPKKKDFVVITLEAYNAMEETAYLLSTPANTEHLMRSLADYKAGNVLKMDIDHHLEAASQKSVHKTTEKKTTKVSSGKKRK